MKTNVCYLGDCLDVLPTLPDNSVDSIVTDPPYGIGFMGKEWDNFKPETIKKGVKTSSRKNTESTDGIKRGNGASPAWESARYNRTVEGNKTFQKWFTEISVECLRVLKPGGHILCCCGTRTQHRMACAIEDSGFEIRDLVAWVYGSGFPKSLDIGKAVDKLQGNKRKVVGTEKIDIGMQNGSMHSGRSVNVVERDLTSGETEWEGWGTALKPAMELWTLARKSLEEKTIAENVLKYGTGGINIDESRVGNETINIHNAPKGTFAGGEPDRGSDTESYRDSVGRFPANLIHDNSEEVLECFPNNKSSKGKFNKKDYSDNENGSTNFKRGNFIGRDDSGSAARFFKSIIYTAKASKSERNKGCDNLGLKNKVFNGKADTSSRDMKGVEEKFTTSPSKNNHPTVKPIALMSYLIKMITPRGGVVLDPFSGSGTTLVAAKDNGFQYIGIEMTEEYLPIIKARTGCEIIKPIIQKEIKDGIELQEHNNKRESDFLKGGNKKHICPKCGLWTKDDGTCEYC